MSDTLDASSTTKPPAVVLTAASAGGVQALSTTLHGVLADCPAPIVIVQHRPARYKSMLAEIPRSALPVTEAIAGETLKPGTVYLARADRDLTVTHAGRFEYLAGHPIRHVLSSTNARSHVTNKAGLDGHECVC
jgi:chemotaxis response regulator CheB